LLSGHMANHLCVGSKASNVGSENGDARPVGLLNHRADGFGIARIQDDRRDVADDEILDLVLLFGHVQFAADHGHAITVLGRLVGHGVGQVLKERICQRQH
jgi:hypothetical protein